MKKAIDGLSGPKWALENEGPLGPLPVSFGLFTALCFTALWLKLALIFFYLLKIRPYFSWPSFFLASFYYQFFTFFFYKSDLSPCDEKLQIWRFPRGVFFPFSLGPPLRALGPINSKKWDNLSTRRPILDYMVALDALGHEGLKLCPRD